MKPYPLSEDLILRSEEYSIYIELFRYINEIFHESENQPFLMFDITPKAINMGQNNSLSKNHYLSREEFVDFFITERNNKNFNMDMNFELVNPKELKYIGVPQQFNQKDISLSSINGNEEIDKATNTINRFFLDYEKLEKKEFEQKYFYTLLSLQEGASIAIEDKKEERAMININFLKEIPIQKTSQAFIDLMRKRDFTEKEMTLLQTNYLSPEYMAGLVNKEHYTEFLELFEKHMMKLNIKDYLTSNKSQDGIKNNSKFMKDLPYSFRDQTLYLLINSAFEIQSSNLYKVVMEVDANLNYLSFIENSKMKKSKVYKEILKQSLRYLTGEVKNESKNQERLSDVLDITLDDRAYKYFVYYVRVEKIFKKALINSFKEINKELEKMFNGKILCDVHYDILNRNAQFKIKVDTRGFIEENDMDNALRDLINEVLSLDEFRFVAQIKDTQKYLPTLKKMEIDFQNCLDLNNEKKLKLGIGLKI